MNTGSLTPTNPLEIDTFEFPCIVNGLVSRQLSLLMKLRVDETNIFPTSLNPVVFYWKLPQRIA